MAANRLAQSGYWWGHYLAKANSYTASKQWLIVNYGQMASSEARTTPPTDKKFASRLLSSLPSKMHAIEKKTKVPISAKKGLLWVVEQMSGFTHGSDHTNIMQRTGFWVSNGLPRYKVWCFDLRSVCIFLQQVTVSKLSLLRFCHLHHNHHHHHHHQQQQQQQQQQYIVMFIVTH